MFQAIGCWRLLRKGLEYDMITPRTIVLRQCLRTAIAVRAEEKESEMSRQIMRNTAGFAGVLALAATLATWSAYATGSSPNHKTDGTNVWIGAASGGSMKELSNWKALVGGVEYTDATSVSNLFMKHVTLDLRGLSGNAVLTNDIAFGNTYKEGNSANHTMLAGLVFNGQDGDMVTIVKAADGNGFHFTEPCYLDVLGGTVNWQDNGASGNYPHKGPHKRGAGVFRYLSVPNHWESTGYVEAGTLAFTNNASANCFSWGVSSGATLKVEPGSTKTRLGNIYTASSANSTARLEVDAGAMCEIVGGWNTMTADKQKFYGTLAGAGTLQLTCGAVQQFLKSNQSGALPFTGLLVPWIGDMAFGTAAAPLGVDASASASLPGGGWLRFHANQELASISGEGVDGGIALDAGQTLTVGGSATTNVFAGRIKGGALVKAGSSSLALTGAGEWTGATTVSGGRLAVGGGAYRPNLAAYWNFDNPDDWGADSSSAGLMPIALRTNPAPTFRPYFVDDGVSGKAIHFGDGSDLTKGGLFYRANMRSVEGQGFPSGNEAFTVSFWMRPTKGKCGVGTNFLRMDSKSSTSPCTNELGNVVYGGGWGNGFYFGSCKRDEDKPSTWLGAFKNLCFYCGAGWTRSGVWNDNGDTKSLDGRVVYAKFADGNYLFDGKWHHVVGTYSNRIMRIFVDGVKMDERTRSANMSLTADPCITVGSYSTDTAHTYQGDLDEIQYLRGAWSEADVLAEYESRRPRLEKVTLPDPIAHWTFDTKREEGGTYYFDDMTGNGLTLKAAFLADSTMTPDVELQMENVTYPENLGSKAFYIKPGKDPSTGWDKAMGGHLELDDGVNMASKFSVGSSFTVSLRRSSCMRNDFFCFGDPDDAAKNIRFYDNGTTPLPTAKVGSNTERNFTGAVLYSNPTTATASWIHQTVTYDSVTKVLCLYVDGKRVNRVTGITVTIDPKQVAVSWNGRTGSSAVYSSTGRFDDLRIYDRVLDDEQVAALAKVVRFSDGTRDDNALLAEQTTVPTNSAVTVASGATLVVRPGMEGTMKSVSGTGTVRMEGTAWTCARALDWSGFTGTISGCGLVAALPGTQLDLTHAASVTADAGFEDGVVVFPSANAGVLVKTPGAVRLPATGTLRLNGATSVGSWAGKKLFIAECASYKGPSDTTGWTFDPAPSGSDEVVGEFKFAAGRLYLQMKGGGTMMLFR